MADRAPWLAAAEAELRAVARELEVPPARDLTAAFLLQVTPSVWTAYRTVRPTGISSGTWLLILGELSCWMIFGLHATDPRLITLGASGTIVSVLMLARIHRTTRRRQSARPAVSGTG